MSEEINNAGVGGVLKEALTLINGKRLDSYGTPETSFTLLANYWSLYLQSKGLLKANTKLSASDAVMILLFLKIARESNKHGHDNVVDMGGYIGLYGEIVNMEEGETK